MHRIATKLLTATIALMFFASGALSVHAQQTTTAPRRSPSTQPRGTTKRPATRRPATRKPASKVQQAAAAGRDARPRKNAVMVAQKLTPSMLKFLNDWEANTANHNRLSAEVEIYDYNDVFMTAQCGIGEIKFEAPDKASLKVTPKDVEGKTIKRKDKTYKLTGMAPQRWVCTGKEIFEFDDKEKTYRVVFIPPDEQGQRIKDGPIPFLFGLKAAEAQKRYLFYQLKPKQQIEHSFWFQAKPLRKIDQQEYKTAFVILDRKQFVPIAISLIDPTGNSQKTYTFKDVKVNPKNGFLNLGRGPFIDPDVKGYKLVSNPGVQAAPGGGRPTADMQPGDARPQANEPQPGLLRISGDKTPARK